VQNGIQHISPTEADPFLVPVQIELKKKKKKKRCCEKFKRKGKFCGSCPLKSCA
jgi:ferric iron reductase protein FhuF